MRASGAATHAETMPSLEPPPLRFLERLAIHPWLIVGVTCAGGYCDASGRCSRTDAGPPTPDSGIRPVDAGPLPDAARFIDVEPL